ncbi:v-type atpase assembly factor pkr1 [Anaeramoeba ignava]|uniref:V-type atpase assembly factor pkr1 n=1 Tax=Anaeramoeba ignava TaxID=1746090 RepID=A0A9Q0RGF2_ANAIG|nr:v-type atpase assembly factor pkr1 [Anaeramoeba ignava]
MNEKKIKQKKPKQKQSLYDWLFKPGVTRNTTTFLFGVVGLLILVLGYLVIIDFNKHYLIMFFLSIGFLSSLIWFVVEYKKIVVREELEKSNENSKEKSKENSKEKSNENSNENSNEKSNENSNEKLNENSNENFIDNLTDNVTKPQNDSPINLVPHRIEKNKLRKVHSIERKSFQKMKTTTSFARSVFTKGISTKSDKNKKDD